MAVEQLEVHCKSYIVRWVKVSEGHTISWSVQPHKKSLNFGIVKHPGTGATSLSSQSDAAEPLSGVTSGVSETKHSRFARKDTITAQDQLASKGFIPIQWQGRCEPDKVSTGTYDVPPAETGMYGLVFDNTFSKQTAKTASLFLITYPTGSPPPTTNQTPPNLSLSAATTAAKTGSRTSLAKVHSNVVAADSVDSLHSHLPGGNTASTSGRSDGTANYHVGNLLKRRRKKGQGYARRFFSLDYSSCTLSYYYNRNSSALRGAIPLSLAAIAADERRREISIDSGAEIWHLRASNAREFNEWARALEKASRIARGLDDAAADDVQDPSSKASARKKPDGTPRLSTSLSRPAHSNPPEAREWEQVEALVSRMVGTRDALRRLVKDMATAPKPAQTNSQHTFLSPSVLVPGEEKDGSSSLSAEGPKRSFWKRRLSATPSTAQAAFQPTVSSALAVSSPAFLAPTINLNDGPSHARKKSRGFAHQEKSMHDHCAALLNDLDSVVAEFTVLIGHSKRRRMSAPLSAAGSRLSVETTSSEEFFDAEVGETGSQIVRINRGGDDDDDDDDDGDDDETPESDDVDEVDVHDSSSVSSAEEDEMSGQGEDTYYPIRPRSLAPLPVDISVDRRATIPPAMVQPPSLIAFVRKNVGKDLSTISMPVSANEPLSLLQRSAEQLEYAQLLDQAAQQKTARDRLLYVAAFAVSHFSNGRAKERAIRKPFNPLLGETYEMLRTEQEVPGGFRLLVEKVSHRPVQLAMQADAASWSLSQSPAPSQKFWGKSAEITTDGRVRVVLRVADGGGGGGGGGTDELYSWTHATMFLRNVVMGEKYVEPVGTMHVSNDTTGDRACVEFRSKGMFGGRGEDVQVDVLGPDGEATGSGLTGTWTAGLRRSENGKAVGDALWQVGGLVDNAANTYGLTRFAAAMNEVTAIEEGRLPPTDTRLRPDQRLAEQGDLDGAEEWKVKLEEGQRARRRELEEKGAEHRPRWFVKVANGPEGEEVWKIRTGKDSYWEERSKGAWSGVTDIFTV
ncbi:oxysterol-binding protein [Sodiomyces alkalinus F11]|uniref:Oxysterol-binding protein n=1 Tax=Sodiomyces alkalinus (strain CBS 110278 / VKM F-3762 / F11) TaxID=1314773 RepID=A0A3N2Q3R8_SODAK|nr:oxysterol-binding protein [Sodiomyces alkalinus F11]ROT41356.1 oxysterol-binding protein [Sodiomyces alkalinus F11]